MMKLNEAKNADHFSRMKDEVLRPRKMSQ